MATGGLRFAGEEGVISVLNTTTGDQQMPDINIESATVTLALELTMKQFIGDLGPTFREFYNGYELELKLQPNDPAQLVAFMNAVIAKAQGLINDEFAVSFKAVSPDRGAFRVTCRDLHWDSLPLDLPSRTDFLTLTLKAKGNVCKFQTV